jgi:hypothetical protein
MSEIIDKITDKLQDLYPQLSIKIVNHSTNRAIIWVNNIKLNEFNPNLLEKELEFLQDRPDYLNLFIEAIKEPIDKYARKISRGVARGSHSKGLSLQQLKEAFSNTKSCMSAARYLHVSYPTLRKYAKMYFDENGVSFFEKYKNPKGVGVSKGSYSPDLGRYSLQDVLDGKSPKYPKWKLKKRLLKNSIIEDKCAICGFEERRVSDYKVPLELDFIDGNENNRKLENLRLLCFNCFFLNVGDFFWRTSRKAEYKQKNNKTD